MLPVEYILFNCWFLLLIYEDNDFNMLFIHFKIHLLIIVEQYINNVNHYDCKSNLNCRIILRSMKKNSRWFLLFTRGEIVISFIYRLFQGISLVNVNISLRTIWHGFLINIKIVNYKAHPKLSPFTIFDFSTNAFLEWYWISARLHFIISRLKIKTS